MSYRSTYLDRHADGADIVRAFGWGAFAAIPTTGLLLLGQGLPDGTHHGRLWCVVAGVAAGCATGAAAYAFSRVTGGAFLSFLLPSGASCPKPAEYSRIEAMAARGDVIGALDAFDAVARAEPGNATVRLQAAELAFRSKVDPHRAEAWLRDVQRLPDRRLEDDVAASYRLVDLYLGALNEPGRALRELRRLADTYRERNVGAQARDALARLKAEQAAR